MNYSLGEILFMMQTPNCGFDSKPSNYKPGVSLSSDVTWSQYEQQEAKRVSEQQKQKEKQLHLEKIQQRLIKQSIIKGKEKENKPKKKKVKKEEVVEE